MSNMGPFPPLPEGVLDWLDDGHTPAPPKPETIRVSPLDQHAHLRRTVGEHHEALQIHQEVLQKHALLHQIQKDVRDAMKRDLERALEPLSRPFLGRLRWLVLGR